MKGGRIFLYLAGLIFSTLPPLLATLSYFPLWTDRGGTAVLSGIAVLLLLFSFIPLFNLIRSHLKSPSAPALWLIIFLLFFILAEIADEMKVIALAGLVGNLIGMLLFRLAKKQPGDNEDEGI